MVRYRIGLEIQITTGVALAVMYWKGLTKESCYKIMFVLGIWEMCAIVMSCFSPAIVATFGITYCSHPILTFVNGCAVKGRRIYVLHYSSKIGQL